MVCGVCVALRFSIVCLSRLRLCACAVVARNYQKHKKQVQRKCHENDGARYAKKLHRNFGRDRKRRLRRPFPVLPVKRYRRHAGPCEAKYHKQQLKTRSVIAFLKRHVNNAYLCWKYKAMARGKRQSLLIRLLHLTQRRNLRRTYLNWIKTWAKSATAQALLVRAVTRRFSKGAGGAFRFWKHQSKSRRGLGKSSLLSPLRATGLSRRALSLRSKKASPGKEASPKPSPRSGGSGKGASSSSTKAAPPPSPASLAANLAAARAQRLLDQAEGNRTPRKEQEKALMDDLAEESESSVVEARLVYAGYGPAFTRDSGDPYNGAPSA